VHHPRFILAAACSLAAHAAMAQPVWRCGSSYSQQPCPGGSVVLAADPRTPAEALKSSSVAQSDMKLADKMEKERLEREKNAPKALVIGPQAAAPVPRPEHKVKKKAKPGQPAQSEQFTAVTAGTPAVKKIAVKKAVVKKPAGKKTAKKTTPV
jgi:hypothetical protein